MWSVAVCFGSYVVRSLCDFALGVYQSVGISYRRTVLVCPFRSPYVLSLAHVIIVWVSSSLFVSDVSLMLSLCLSLALTSLLARLLLDFLGVVFRNLFGVGIWVSMAFQCLWIIQGLFSIETVYGYKCGSSPTVVYVLSPSVVVACLRSLVM